MGNTCSYLLIMQTYMEMHVYKAKKKRVFQKLFIMIAFILQHSWNSFGSFL